MVLVVLLGIQVCDAALNIAVDHTISSYSFFYLLLTNRLTHTHGIVSNTVKIVSTPQTWNKQEEIDESNFSRVMSDYTQQIEAYMSSALFACEALAAVRSLCFFAVAVSLSLLFLFPSPFFRLLLHSIPIIH